MDCKTDDINHTVAALSTRIDVVHDTLSEAIGEESRRRAANESGGSHRCHDEAPHRLGDQGQAQRRPHSAAAAESAAAARMTAAALDPWRPTAIAWLPMQDSPEAGAARREAKLAAEAARKVLNALEYVELNSEASHENGVRRAVGRSWRRSRTSIGSSSRRS